MRASSPALQAEPADLARPARRASTLTDFAAVPGPTSFTARTWNVYVGAVGEPGAGRGAGRPTFSHAPAVHRAARSG